MHNHPTFGPALKQCLESASHDQILEALKPIDVAGLTHTHRGNWYPVDADDLRNAAHKVEATPQEIEALLQACGFAT
jgi:FADH2 O2-dependent halogenase